MPRPIWCPEQSCEFVCQSQFAICIGKLPKPELHDGVPNTHRFCLHSDDPGDTWTFPLKHNRADAWNLVRILNIGHGGLVG